MQLDLENIYADLDYEANPLLTASKMVEKDAVEKEALSKLQAHIARDFMNPETQKIMEQVLSSTREKAIKPNPLDESKSKKEFFLDEVGDDIELDLEEVGEEVDDIFAKSINRSMDDTNERSFDKGLSTSRKLGLQAGSNPSPPKSNPVAKSKKSTDHFLDIDFHMDWDLKAALETASKSLKKPSEMPPPNHLPDGSKMGSTSLWTPALARHQTQVPKNRVGYQTKDNDWEVETPYVGRKDKSEVQRSAAPARTAINAGLPCDVSPSIPFALPLSEPQSIHRNSHKVAEISLESKEGRMIQQTDVLFPSAQSIPSSIPSVVQSIPSSIPSIISHTINQPSKPNVSSADQGALDTTMLPSCTTNLIRDAVSEKELYHSPKEGATAPKKVSQEQTPQKSSESPKRSKRKRRKEKKTKRKKDSSEDEDDSSDSDDSKEDKKLSHENEKDSDEVEMLFFKKESLMKRVKLLVEQKKIMSNQREDIISNHKGSKASLSSILEENSFLTQEIGKQIENINKMIKNVNQDIESKRGNFKQKTSLSKERSESPHVSGETHKKPQYSSEKERISKKMIKPTERSEVYRGSPYQEKRSKSPYRKNSRSPSPSHFKRGSSEVEHTSRDRDGNNSRSPKSIRHKRSRSPSCNVFREAPKPVPPPEVKQNASPPKKRAIKSMIEVGKKPAGAVSQYQTPKNVDSSVQYAPHEAQRTYIRYTDQGMHWCKLCSLFCETAPEYVNHLMTESHLARVKNDRRSWLSKAPREEKDPKPPNAQVLTVPIQGLEFLHSLPCYYCSLCDAFLRDRGEALRHPESKMHVSKYKVHRAQNPLFESTFLKAKTTAYAKYKIDEERKKMENELSLNEKNTSVENKLLKQIKEKLDKENKEDRTCDSRDDPVKACSSIRVASRGPRYSTDKKPSTSHSSPSNTSRHSREKESFPVSSDSSKKTGGVKDSKVETQKSELVDSEHDEDNGEVSIKVSDKPGVEDKVETRPKEDGSRDRDTDRKAASTKLPLIGKMPFLKRKAGISKSKPQQSTPPEEVPKLKKDMKEDVSSEKLKIPLPSCTVDDNEVNTALEQTQSTIPKEADDRKLPVTSMNIKEDFIPPYDPSVPPPPFTGAKTWSTSDKKDTSGSALYDPLEAGDEDSSDGAAAATIEALDLLNIPLPGFKTPTEVSAVPLPPETEDVYQPEDMEIENIPLDEGSIEGGIEEVYPPSGIIVHPDIPFPPAVGILTTLLSSEEPPPPGTEGTDSSLNCELGGNINSGNILPVFGPQEFIPKKTTPCKIQKNKDANIPVPPGTEDEYNAEDIDCFSRLSGHSKDKVERISRQRLHSESGSQGSSKGAPPSFSGKILQNSLMKPLTAPKIQQMDKQLPCHKERELTPPPPGTESLSDEKDQSIMDTSNMDAIKDLEITRAESALMPPILKISTSKEKVLSSTKSYSSSILINTSSYSLNLLGSKGEVDPLQGKTSEILQNICIKDSSNKFSTVGGKSKELDPKYSDEERSCTPLSEQPDAKNIAISSNAGSFSWTDKAALPSEEGIFGSELSPSVSLMDNRESVNSKTVVSSNIDDNSSNHCLTINTPDENQDSSSIDKDRSCTPLPEKHDNERETTSPVNKRLVGNTMCDTQDSDKGSAFKKLLCDEEMNLKKATNSVCDSQDSDKGSAFRECLSDEQLSSEETTEGVCDSQESDKSSASKECLPDEQISFKENTDNVCDGQESDKDSTSKECLPDEQMCLKELAKDNNECCVVVGEASFIHGSDNRCQTSRQDDTAVMDTTSPVNTPSASNTECDSQDSEKGSVSKECLLEEQDSNVSSSLKETPEDSNECSAIMNEKDLTLSIDINEEPKSPIIKCGSPLQLVNFPKGFESMDIADFYSPSTSDSTCAQNVDSSETTILKTENYPFPVSAENMMDAQDLSGTPQRKANFTKEDTTEFYVEKDQKEPKAAEGPSCSQTIEIHEKESDTNKDSNEHHDFHSHEGHDFLESKDVKDEAFPVEHPSERKVARSFRRIAEIAEYKEQETSRESEEISHDSAILIDEVDSKTSEEESASNSGSVKEGKRKPVRKATRKRTTKIKKTEEDECPSPRTSASRSSAGCLSPSFVESPRPMRSSRRAAAAAIKAMAKDQDDTPPDSPPSDDDDD